MSVYTTYMPLIYCLHTAYILLLPNLPVQKNWYFHQSPLYHCHCSSLVWWVLSQNFFDILAYISFWDFGNAEHTDPGGGRIWPGKFVWSLHVGKTEKSRKDRKKKEGPSQWQEGKKMERQNDKKCQTLVSPCMEDDDTQSQCQDASVGPSLENGI